MRIWGDEYLQPRLAPVHREIVARGFAVVGDVGDQPTNYGATGCHVLGASGGDVTGAESDQAPMPSDCSGGNPTAPYAGREFTVNTRQYVVIYDSRLVGESVYGHAEGSEPRGSARPISDTCYASFTLFLSLVSEYRIWRTVVAPRYQRGLSGE